MKSRVYVIAILFSVSLTSCGYSNIDMVKDYVDELNPALSLGEVLESYKYFTKTEWEEKEGSRGIKYVEFTAYYSNKSTKTGFLDEGIKDAIIKIQFPINKAEDGFDIGFEGYKDLSKKDSEFKSYAGLVFKQGDLIRLIYENQPLWGLNHWELNQFLLRRDAVN